MVVGMLAALALAQQTTTCLPMGIGVQCQTQPNNPMEAFDRSREAALRAGEARRRAQREQDEFLAANPSRCASGDWWLVGCSRGQHDAARQQRQAAEQAATAREETMTLLRAGDCEAAVRAALGTGDLAFAGQVRDFCSPK